MRRWAEREGKKVRRWNRNASEWDAQAWRGNFERHDRNGTPLRSNRQHRRAAAGVADTIALIGDRPGRKMPGVAVGWMARRPAGLRLMVRRLRI